VKKAKNKKKGAASKPKGSSWERDLAKKLTESTGQEFRRVPLSGAFMGGSNRYKNEGILSGAQEGLSGDIMGPDGWCFNIECKNTLHYPRFHLMLQTNDSVIDGYLLESMTDAHHSNKIPLLALKRTRRGEFMMVPRNLALTAVDFGAPDPEAFPHIIYIFKGSSETIPLYYNWLLMDCKIFIFNAEAYWKAGKSWLDDIEYFQKKY